MKIKTNFSTMAMLKINKTMINILQFYSRKNQIIQIQTYLRMFHTCNT